MSRRRSQAPEQHPGTYLLRGMLGNLASQGLLPEPDEDGWVLVEDVEPAMPYVRAYLAQSLQIGAVRQAAAHQHPHLAPPLAWVGRWG